MAGGEDWVLTRRTEKGRRDEGEQPEVPLLCYADTGDMAEELEQLKGGSLASVKGNCGLEKRSP